MRALALLAFRFGEVALPSIVTADETLEAVVVGGTQRCTGVHQHSFEHTTHFQPVGRTFFAGRAVRKGGNV